MTASQRPLSTHVFPLGSKVESVGRTIYYSDCQHPIAKTLTAGHMMLSPPLTMLRFLTVSAWSIDRWRLLAGDGMAGLLELLRKPPCENSEKQKRKDHDRWI